MLQALLQQDHAPQERVPQERAPQDLPVFEGELEWAARTKKKAGVSFVFGCGLHFASSSLCCYCCYCTGCVLRQKFPKAFSGKSLLRVHNDDGPGTLAISQQGNVQIHQEQERNLGARSGSCLSTRHDKESSDAGGKTGEN